MPKAIPESELILNADGSVYHLHLRPEHISDRIITVGDPDRVPMVSKYFDSIEFTTRKREFVTHTGTFEGKRISVVSTGMGTDNIEILMTELDALVNIDLATRTPTDHHTRLKIVRVGTSGSMQADIPVDSLLASSNALGMDTLMSFYHLDTEEQEDLVCKNVKEELNLSFQPYCLGGSEYLLNTLGLGIEKGATVTCPGFYAPQGRHIRLKPAIDNMLERLANLRCGHVRFTNFEMETAGYYAMGRLLGHEVLSFNAIVANRITKTFSQNADIPVDKLIQHVLKNF